VLPTYTPELLDALEGAARPFDGWIWRAVIGDSDPERPNTRGARWNPPRVEALYFSLKPEGAQNELEAVIARQPVPIRRPLRLFQFRAVLDRIAYLTGDTLASVGYPVETLIGEGWAGPSTIGGAASWLGLSGLLVPSARHRGSNLVVFLQNLGPRERVELVGEVLKP
jgi:RES domain-containing protein